MSNFRKFISVSAVAVLAATNLLTSLTYAAEAKAWASLQPDDFRRNPLEFLMPDNNVYLYAVTEPNTYYVAFHGNTGTGTMADQTFTYDQEQELTENAFTKTWYTYSGWNTEENNSGTGYADKDRVKNLATTGTVDMYAQWNVNSYNITYDLNDTEWSSSWVLTPTPAVTVNYDSWFTVANPSRTWYTFSGWDISNMDSEEHTVGWVTTSETSTWGVKGTAFENLRATSGTVEFLAQWIANLTPYTVKHCKEVLTPAGTYETDCAVENLSGYTDHDVTPAVTGYDWFTAPSTQTEKVKADGSTEITYDYDRNSYTLTLIAGTWVESAKGTGTVNTDGVTTTENNTNTGSFRFEEPIEFSYVLKSWYQNATWSGYGDTASTITMPVGGAVKEISAETITYAVTGYYHWGKDTSDGTQYTTTYNVETSFTLPTGLKRDNSIFLWWTGTEVAETTENVTVGPGKIWNREYHAVWSCESWYTLGTDQCVPNTDTEYVVEHYQQQLNGSYTLIDTETPHGTTDTTAVWTGKEYTWFSGWYLSGAEQTIHWDVTNNKTVVQVRYDRESYDYTIAAPAWGVEATAITSSGITAAHPNGDGKITYGDTVTLNADMAPGYEFDYWEVTDGTNPVTVTNSGNIDEATFTMPASSVTITPHLKQTSFTISYELNSWSVSEANPTSYTVESDSFTLNNPTRDHSEFLGWSWTDITSLSETVTIAKWSVWNRSYEAVWWCVAWYHAEGNSCVANGYTIAVHYDDPDQTDTSYEVTYDASKTIGNPSKSWYIFTGWKIEWMSGAVNHYVWSESNTTTATWIDGIKGDYFKNLTTVSGGTVTLTAVWEADEVTYKVHHMIEDVNADTYTQSWDAVTHSWTSDDTVTFTSLKDTYDWFTYSGWNLSGGTTYPNEVKTETVIDRHGTTHIYLYYDRNRYQVTTDHDNGVESVTWSGRYDFEAPVNVEAHVKTWYHFVQWTWTPAPAPTSVTP